MRRTVALSAAIVLIVGLCTRTSLACPFCSAVSLTFAQEMKAADAAVIAELVELPKASGETDGPPGLGDALAKGKFRIREVLKGAEHLNRAKHIEAIYFGESPIGSEFLVFGVDPMNLAWSTPISLTKRGREYLEQIMKLPETGADRLVFFQQHLEDSEEMLARDAHDEFAIAPYDDVKALAPRMNRQQLIEWINDPETSPSHRRLYFTMLGVCGSKQDVPMLESMLRSDDRRVRAGLDAMIGCYLALDGPDGLALVEDLFLKNPKAEFVDTNAAIRSIRITEEAGIIDRQAAAASLRHVLKNSQLADLVIPDLARWQDWSVIDQLSELFVNANEQNAWIRVPVLRYLQVCPLPEAKQQLTKLEKLDSDAAKRASSFLPIGGGAPARSTPTNTDEAGEQK